MRAQALRGPQLRRAPNPAPFASCPFARSSSAAGLDFLRSGQWDSGLAAYLASNVPVIFSDGWLASYQAFTNLILASENLTDPFWPSALDCTLLSGQPSPDGLSTAYQLTDNSTTQYGHIASSNLTVAVGDATFYCFVAKQSSGAPVLEIQIPTSTAVITGGASIQMQLDPVTGNTHIMYGGANNVFAIDAGAFWIFGWTFTVTTAGTLHFTVYPSVTTAIGTRDLTVMGSNTVWGFQLTETSYPVTYEPTAGTASTRQADQMTLVNGDPLNMAILNAMSTVGIWWDWIPAHSSVTAPTQGKFFRWRPSGGSTNSLYVAVQAAGNTYEITDSASAQTFMTSTLAWNERDHMRSFMRLVPGQPSDCRLYNLTQGTSDLQNKVASVTGTNWNFSDWALGLTCNDASLIQQPDAIMSPIWTPQ